VVDAGAAGAAVDAAAGGDVPDSNDNDDDELADLCADPAYAFLDECLDYDEEYDRVGCSLATGEDRSGLGLLLVLFVLVGESTSVGR
jgi:hypothetical protein